MAYKVFTNGSVLNASEINDNLMNQSVMVFSNSTARAAALTAPVEGMLTWLQDVNRYEYRDGAGAWVQLGQAGLNLITTLPFTGATSVDFDGVFTSTYQNYRLLLTATATAQANISLRLRAATVPSTANYFYVAAHQRTNGTIITPSSGNPGGFGLLNIIAASNRAHGVYDIFSPQIATPTDMTFSASSQDPTGPFISTGGFRHTVSTAYDGFSVTTNAGTITGKVQLFGYRD